MKAGFYPPHAVGVTIARLVLASRARAAALRDRGMEDDAIKEDLLASMTRSFRAAYSDLSPSELDAELEAVTAQVIDPAIRLVFPETTAKEAV